MFSCVCTNISTINSSTISTVIRNSHFFFLIYYFRLWSQKFLKKCLNFIKFIAVSSLLLNLLQIDLLMKAKTNVLIWSYLLKFNKRKIIFLKFVIWSVLLIVIYKKKKHYGLWFSKKRNHMVRNIFCFGFCSGGGVNLQ